MSGKEVERVAMDEQEGSTKRWMSRKEVERDRVNMDKQEGGGKRQWIVCKHLGIPSWSRQTEI